MPLASLSAGSHSLCASTRFTYSEIQNLGDGPSPKVEAECLQRQTVIRSSLLRPLDVLFFFFIIRLLLITIRKLIALKLSFL